MKNSTESMKRPPKTNETTVETIASIQLEDVTGGCARCGCGTQSQSGPNVGTFAAFAATFRR